MVYSVQEGMIKPYAPASQPPTPDRSDTHNPAPFSGTDIPDNLILVREAPYLEDWSLQPAVEMTFRGKTPSSLFESSLGPAIEVTD